ncbi:ATP-binding cassette domain-containing protein [Duganella violaceipulchra]|uniref:ABC-type iron transport system FetAB ATPase subunit n=1 Tax=Duganella violaceipulchra TaxID=2849652 RepID=A0AA41H6K3_9BURK|nr:ATP-binding cassette domain-containing protein [Duganella violaceicalia]MBV6321314.1 ATP-binding cassette domain-containing protein [Duganella violaceicalia]MCP2009438.1 ABC-type iron transport system FetAB ATPase subunit [Duganella violaceicalia]
MIEPNGAASPRLRIRNLQSPLAGPFSFDLAAGECLTISGASGAGKSLLLRMLCDLDPNTGEALLDGLPRSGMGAPAWRAGVVYQPAEAAWWLPTAGDHFKPAQMARVRELLPQLNLSPALLEADISRLSTGERQRMALVRSLACKPQVLLLDEPTAALDPVAVAATERLLQKELDAGLAIILVTHSEAQAQTLGHRSMTMCERRLTENGAAP